MRRRAFSAAWSAASAAAAAERNDISTSASSRRARATAVSSGSAAGAGARPSLASASAMSAASAAWARNRSGRRCMPRSSPTGGPSRARLTKLARGPGRDSRRQIAQLTAAKRTTHRGETYDSPGWNVRLTVLAVFREDRARDLAVDQWVDPVLVAQVPHEERRDERPGELADLGVRRARQQRVAPVPPVEEAGVARLRQRAQDHRPARGERDLLGVPGGRGHRVLARRQ